MTVIRSWKQLLTNGTICLIYRLEVTWDPAFDSTFVRVTINWCYIKKDLKNRKNESVLFFPDDYLLTNRKNAVLSTTKFVQSDKHLCIELLVGLCPDCRLNVSLMNRGADIPIKSISGLENTGCNGLMSWQSVRITTTLLDSKLTKLNIVTILSKDGVQGGWAIDSFRTCEPISKLDDNRHQILHIAYSIFDFRLGGLRKSTIPINRMRMTSTTSLWPGVKCQKLSYTGSTIVNSPLINIYPNLGASEYTVE